MKKSSESQGKPCGCSKETHDTKLIVLTGGPGAGKTAVLEMVRRTLCKHVVILPEAASIIFNGGFRREKSLAAKKGAQRAIYHVQREQERILEEEKSAAIGLCDRGTLDGLAYWPNSKESYFQELGTNSESEIRRYSTVIHLKTPSLEFGYNHSNPTRIEQASEASEIDKKIVEAWDSHPRRQFIESSEDFLQKASKAIELIGQELPACCKSHFGQLKKR